MAAAAVCACSTSLGAQADQTLYVVRYIEATAASQGQVATLLKQFVESSRADGAVRFEALQSTTHPNEFLMLEVWKDQKTLDAHTEAAHSRQFRMRVEPLLLAPADDRLCVATFVAPPRGGRGLAYVVTHVDVPGNFRDATLPALQALAERSRSEAGNLQFDVVHQKNRTNHFTVIGVWADQKGEEAHQAAPYTMSFRGTVSPMLGALYDQRWYRPL